ncbi:MAG: MucBP domain-containing protein, partial [Oscillospiraceae bacterium]|nr:MucBP domain-containing protein [Oscillospiraceae bacterium]
TYKYNGNTETEQVLTGLAPANVPSKETLNAAAPAGQCFKAWDKDVTAAVTENKEFNAIYANDANDNDIPDDEETAYTVTYNYNGNTETEQVLTGLVPAKVPSKETLNAVAPAGQCFKAWDGDVTAAVTADIEFNAIYTNDANDNDIPDENESSMLNISYVYADGSQAAEPYSEEYSYDAAYSVTSPVISGYVADKLVVSGKMGLDDISVTVTYKADANDNNIPDEDESFKLNISYVYADGSKAAEPYSAEYKYDAAYSVTSPVLAGYTVDKAVVSGKMGLGDVNVTVTYTAIANGTEYTVNYVYSDGTNEYVLETKTVTATAGDTVAVADLRKDFGGYTYDRASVTDETFTVAGDKSTSITLYYIIKDGDHEDNNPDSGDHYTITYDADGGVLSGEYTTKYTVRDDITLATATKTGYVFNGWKVTKVEDASANSWTLDANLGK